MKLGDLQFCLIQNRLAVERNILNGPCTINLSCSKKQRKGSDSLDYNVFHHKYIYISYTNSTHDFLPYRLKYFTIKYFYLKVLICIIKELTRWPLTQKPSVGDSLYSLRHPLSTSIKAANNKHRQSTNTTFILNGSTTNNIIR